MNNRFIDEKNEFLVGNMFPKRPWLNYAWNSEYVSSFSQFGFGISRYRDDKGFKKSILAETDNRLIFIKDKNTKEYYAANRNYDNKDFDVFETIVGQGYSVIKSQYKGLACNLKIFVPDDGLVECWEVSLENKSNADKDISLYAYANIDTALSPIDGFSVADFSEELNGIFAKHAGDNIDSDINCMYFTTSEKVDFFETTNRRFKGEYSDIGHPIGIEADHLSNGGTCFELKIGAALQFDITIEKNSEKKLYFALGASRSFADAKKECDRLLSKDAYKAEFDKVQTKIEKFRENIMIDTPDDDINRRVNVWLKRQIELGKQWGRLYGKGFRDIMQDTAGFLSLDAQNARERILYALQYQREDGNPIRQWEPIMRELYADGAVWLIFTVNTYLKETADFGILDEKVGYFESKLEETVLEHCFRGIDYLQNNLGERGLCLWFGGDWNDSINACGLLGKGESVWLSEATYKAAYEFIEILNRIGKNERTKEIAEKAEKMKKNILKYGWNEDHFIYGINDYDEKIGSYETPEGQFFLNSQTWAVLSGIVEGDDAKKLMDRVEENLGCSYGYLQNTPSYTTPDRKIGRLSFMGKGIYENGSVYNHGVAFKSVADTMVYDGDAALDTIKRILPSNPENANSGVEPYAMSNMYFGPECNVRKGDAPQSWITGTSGWLFRCIVENIIGLQPEYDGLSIKPMLPKAWDKVSVRRVFRGAVYNITIEQTANENSVTADGISVYGNILPLYTDGEHDICVKISK